MVKPMTMWTTKHWSGIWLNSLSEPFLLQRPLPIRSYPQNTKWMFYLVFWKLDSKAHCAAGHMQVIIVLPLKDQRSVEAADCSAAFIEPRPRHRCSLITPASPPSDETQRLALSKKPVTVINRQSDPGLESCEIGYWDALFSCGSGVASD